MITYDLDRRGNLSKHEYLYRCIRRDIRAGLLTAGSRLPSKRALADHLSVSVSTVEHAYDLLVSGGYVQARRGSGFYVAEHRNEGDYSLDAAGSHDPSSALSAVPSEEDAATIDFRANRCSMELFPVETWTRVMRRKLSERDPSLFETVPFNGLLELREAIAEHLFEFRGMQVDPGCIVIGAGTEFLYGRLLQLFGVGVVIAMTDPGYKKLAAVGRGLGVSWEHVPIDTEGIRVDLLEAGKAEVAHVSPANLFPMGVSMSPRRRRELLDWVHASPERYIVEDDYDSEFHFNARPQPPLFTSDTTGHVVYLNTFSKTLVPSIRISYMVLPPDLMSIYRSQLGFYSCTVSSFEQLALAEFMRGGYFERHVNRLRRYYARQRDQIVNLLRVSPLARVAKVQVPDVGTHLLLTLHTALSDEEIKAAALARGMAVATLLDYCVQPSTRYAHRVVINYAGIQPEQMPEAVDLLVDVFRDDISRVQEQK